MISDISSMPNPSHNKQNVSNVTLGNTGTLAKLSNELKLIESFNSVKIQGSETLSLQGKPVQLLHVTGTQQPFSLINTGLPIDVNDLKSAQLNKTNAFQATLGMTKETLPSQTQRVSSTPQVKQVENLILASRVVNLTVLSTQPTEGNSTLSPQTKASQNTAQPNNTQSINSTPIPLQKNTVPTSTSKIDTTPTGSVLTNSTTPNTSSANNQKVNSIQTNIAPPTTQLATVTDGKTEFPIISQAELKRGDVIRVLVDANSHVQVLPSKTSEVTTSPQSEALKQSLPKQLSSNEMSQLIKQLHTISESSSSNLPPQTQRALTQLVQSLPNLTNLTTSPDTMKQAIQTSGTFSESLLLNDNKAELLSHDLKLNLNKLKETQESIGALRLGSIPTEQIANAIERITTTQLRQFSDSNQVGTPNYPLHIELPIKDGELHSLVQIQINKDSNTQEEKKQERRWLVKLKFDFEETGKFEARTSIQGNKVSIIFVAEEKGTLQKLQTNIPSLKQQLREKDIDIEKLDTFQAKLTQEEANQALKNTQLIDVRT